MWADGLFMKNTTQKLVLCFSDSFVVFKKVWNLNILVKKWSRFDVDYTISDFLCSYWLIILPRVYSFYFLDFHWSECINFAR